MHVDIQIDKLFKTKLSQYANFCECKKLVKLFKTWPCTKLLKFAIIVNTPNGQWSPPPDGLVTHQAFY